MVKRNYVNDNDHKIGIFKTVPSQDSKFKNNDRLKIAMNITETMQVIDSVLNISAGKFY